MSSHPPQFNVYARACPSRAALEVVTNRWAVLALCALRDRPLRFNGLARAVDGVSQKMLSQTLHALERDGLVIRDAQPTNPPHVEYRLTPFGTETARQLRSLIALVEGRMDDVLLAQSAYDERRAHEESRAYAEPRGTG
jgi:DNA-binding HxlR family transcriptional regulator